MLVWLERRSIFTHKKTGPFSGAQPFDRLARHVVNGLDIGPIDIDPVVRLKHAQRERIDLPRRAADAVSVVLHHEHHRELPFLRKADRLEEIALPRRRVADGRDDKFGLPSSLIPQAMPQAGRSWEPVGVGTLQMWRSA